ncbi:MAG: MBL fold metallo-hydrolase [Treponema sp.]|jgi:glyoxylase-like metal-dependent hydrolase (beta-lactamase superfamily II)|nr:MBL fold metallo-hydrolase [Treponema sp.]
MKVFMHYCPYGFSNCYILGTEIEDGFSPRDAVVVDPGSMEEPMLDFIESHGYRLQGVLVTHDHVNHVHGLRTLERIYNTAVYAVNPLVRGHKTRVIHDGDILTLGAITVAVITVPGHSSDSAVFRINQTLLTGDTITAGLLGSAGSPYGKTKQMEGLRSKILSLPGNYVVLPGHGPPSTLDAERQYNAGIRQYETNKNSRPPFRINLD